MKSFHKLQAFEKENYFVTRRRWAKTPYETGKEVLSCREKGTMWLDWGGRPNILWRPPQYIRAGAPICGYARPEPFFYT